MSEIKVNKISPRTNCGTVQLGDSGDTITIPAGATITNNGTQTGFGRTGTVDWQTAIKTVDFTAASGEGYFINTTSGAITMTLPSSPSVGDIVAIKDYANTFDTNNLTINRNSQPIGGETINPVISVEGQAITMVYGDSTKGWQAVYAATESDLPKPEFIVACGGTVTTSGNFKIHTFTGPGTFNVTAAGNSAGSNSVDYMVVAGGGGGGGTNWPPGPYGSGGGGGAGGWRASSGTASGCYNAAPSPLAPSLTNPVSALSVTVQAYPITVGGGGAAGPGTGRGGSGNNSIFSITTSTGGGGGGSRPPGCGPALAGGSGGGGGSACQPVNNCGGTGNTPVTSPPQGNNGGNGPQGTYPATGANGGGGGGAIAVGANSGKPGGGAGGSGATSCITGSPVAYAGGGGGGQYCSSCGSGAGGAGGGGPGGPGACSTNHGNGQAGTDNTGGGGGGGSTNGPQPSARTGGAGGSGIVVIRYKFQ